ncbi:MAG TPA: acetyl-CoA decarbonylase/synthase complex subunit alpha/beta, partial [Armatimonadota bacterium]
MSKLIAASAIRGAYRVVGKAEEAVARVLAEHGPDCPVAFPSTAYALPVIYSMLGTKVGVASDMEAVLAECRGMLPPVPSDAVWLPYLGGTLDAGMATLLCFELIEACKMVLGPPPVQGIWLGAADDVIIRERGIEFVDGTAPGFAAVVGAAPDKETAVRIARELQQKNLYVFMAGHTNGVAFAEQLQEAGVDLGWETRLVPFGKEISAAIYALGFASRAALSFGGVKPGDYRRNLLYNKNRVFAFVMALGEVDEEKYAAAAGAINYGFPTIADTDIPEILPSGICTYEHVVSRVPHDRIVEKSLEVRGCKVKITQVPIPVSYGAAFEGERVRRENTRVEFGGNRTPAFEFVTTGDLAEVEDGRIDVVGPDLDEAPVGGSLPLAIWVTAAGRKMQADFEPILERQIHHLLNGAEGVMHVGQRDIVWLRISQSSFDRGFRLRHIGEILRAKLLNEYPAIVDKIQVALYTRQDEVEARLSHARQVFRERNQRMATMTDENVDTFYGCLLCQSFAPNHVCVITPERLGLCGAYNWLDGKAAYEIDPTGPNQPVLKGECLDPVRGVWQGVNEYVYQASRQTLSVFSAYSLVTNPMTSCGCFECVVALLPECNGVMIVNREYPGDTPCGMRFSTLAGVVGGGQQTPGFVGVGKAYLSSSKFISADGGLRRVVWMPKELKEMLREDLTAAAERAGVPDLLDRIADETVSSEPAGISEHMERVGHPALTMPDITAGPEAPASAGYAEEASASSGNGNGRGHGLEPGASEVPVAEAPARVIDAPPEPPASLPLGDSSPEEPAVPAPPPAAPPAEGPAFLLPSGVADLGGSLRYVASLLDGLGATGAPPSPDPAAALQISTAMNLMVAGANMLRLAGIGGAPPPAAPPRPQEIPAPLPAAPVESPAAGPQAPSEVALPAPTAAPPPSPAPQPLRMAPPTILIPNSVPMAAEGYTGRVREVTLGGSGTRTSALTLGGAAVMPFRHYEGAIGHPAAVAAEVFDRLPDNYPRVLREAYGERIADPPALARYCVEELGAQAISLRLDGAHPDNGGRSPSECSDLVGAVLKAVGVPLLVTGPSHYETTNQVLRQVAADHSGENLLLNWAETDNHKTLVAAAMGYGHCVVCQTPIDVNMAKQLNILATNL